MPSDSLQAVPFQTSAGSAYIQSATIFMKHIYGKANSVVLQSCVICACRATKFWNFLAEYSIVLVQRKNTVSGTSASINSF